MILYFNLNSNKNININYYYYLSDVCSSNLLHYNPFIMFSKCVVIPFKDLFLSNIIKCNLHLQHGLDGHFCWNDLKPFSEVCQCMVLGSSLWLCLFVVVLAVEDFSTAVCSVKSGLQKEMGFQIRR